MKSYLSVLCALVLVLSLVAGGVLPGATSVKAATPIYVKAARPNDAGDGTSWGTAKKTIQAAINVVDSGGTVVVYDGVYTENITINKTLTLKSAAGSDNCTINASGNVTAVLINSTNVILGVKNKGFTITGAASYGVRLNASNITIDSDNISGNPYGIWVTGSDHTIQRNLITSNTNVGIRLPGATGHNQIWYNNIHGNTNYGIYAESISGQSQRRQWAGYNWWGDASGPSGTGLTTTGDNVNENVWYNPWLNNTFSSILTAGIADISMGVNLKVGWNTVATPLPLAAGSNQWNQIVARSSLGTHVTSTYDADTGFSTLADSATTVLSPLDAVFIKMATTGIVSFKISTATWAPRTRDLKQGWNLIGASMAMTQQELEMWQVLKSVDRTSGGLVGYDMVVSPPLATQPSWVYVRGQETVEENYEWQNMKMCRGYWIYMENADEMAGFGSTPITAKIWD